MWSPSGDVSLALKTSVSGGSHFPQVTAEYAVPIKIQPRPPLGQTHGCPSRYFPLVDIGAGIVQGYTVHLIIIQRELLCDLQDRQSLGRFGLLTGGEAVKWRRDISKNSLSCIFAPRVSSCCLLVGAIACLP